MFAHPSAADRIALAVLPQSQQQQQQQNPEPDPPCNDGPSYMERYVDWTDDYLIDPGAAVGLLLFGVWPKSLAPATGGRAPALGSKNPVTSVPRAFGYGGDWAGSVRGRQGIAAIGLVTMLVGTYDATIAAEGF